MTFIVAEAVAAVLVLVVVLSLVHRSRRNRDSIGRYARAVSALRDIADHPPVFESPVSDAVETPRLMLVVDGGAPVHSRRRNCRGARPDPDVVARRPVVAHLPAVPAGRYGRRDPEPS